MRKTDKHKYTSFAIKKEGVKILTKLAEIDMRTIPTEIIYLAKEELKRRNIIEMKDNGIYHEVEKEKQSE